MVMVGMAAYIAEFVELIGDTDGFTYDIGTSILAACSIHSLMVFGNDA